MEKEANEATTEQTGARGRPQGDHKVRKQQIAEATWNVIARLGISGATMRAIARETGYSTGVLSHYFHNKEEILEFAVAALFDLLEQQVDALDHSLSAPEEMRKFLHLFLPVDEFARFFWSLWMHIVVDAPNEPARAALLSDFQRDMKERIQSIIERGIKEGTIRSNMQSSISSDLLHATIDGLSGTWIFDERFTPEYMAELIDNIILMISEDSTGTRE
jgi:AcrR family transcriptional regulator